MDQRRAVKTCVLAAVATFAAANLIHNRGVLDAAAFPGIVFAALMLWRPHRAFLFAAALCVALPAMMFLNWAALLDPSRVRPFVNHLFLLLAVILAVTGAARALVPAAR